MTPEEILELTKHFLALAMKQWPITQQSTAEWDKYGPELAEQVSLFHSKLTKSSK